MKKVSILLCLSLLATAPLQAQSPIASDAFRAVDGVVHLGTLNFATGEIVSELPEKAVGDILWDNTVASGSFGIVGPAQEFLDEGDLPAGSTGQVIQGFQIGFATDATTLDLRYVFYTNDNFDTVGSPLATQSGGEAIYDFSFTGLTGGGFFAYTLDVDLGGDGFIIAGPDLDLDGDTDWGFGVVVTNPGDGTSSGPLLASPGPSAVGAPGANIAAFDIYSPPVLDAGAAYLGTFAFAPPLPSQFHMQLVEGAFPSVEVPTASEYGLLALMLALMGAAFFMMRRR